MGHRIVANCKLPCINTAFNSNVSSPSEPRRYGLHFLTSGLRQSATETFFSVYAGEISDAELKTKARETL